VFCDILAISHAGKILPLSKDVLELKDINPRQDDHRVQDDDPPKQPDTESPECIAQLRNTRHLLHKKYSNSRITRKKPQGLHIKLPVTARVIQSLNTLMIVM